jgi:alpha-tubulin suppressor-like RCC1 family protein
VFCWGSNQSGQLGLSPADVRQSPAPRRVNGLPFAREIAAAGDVTCVLAQSQIRDRYAKDDRLVPFCWGDPSSGLTGDEHDNARGLPHPITLPTSVAPRGIVVSATHACVAATETWCWGRNDHGQLGLPPSNGVIHAPLKLSAGACTSPEIVTVGSSFTCFRDSASQICCMGRGDRGQLGRGTRAMADHVARPAILPRSASAVIAAFSHACAVFHREAADAASYAWCWGSNSAEELQPQGPEDLVAPVPLGLPALRLDGALERK